MCSLLVLQKEAGNIKVMLYTLNVKNRISLFPVPYCGPNRAVFLSLLRIMFPLPNIVSVHGPLRYNSWYHLQLEYLQTVITLVRQCQGLLHNLTRFLAVMMIKVGKL
jgi:hypothetical protein